MRHAIYFTPPPGSPLHGLGSSWLGRDSVTGDILKQPDASLHEVTKEARRYGFHATLKPPFVLKAGAQLSALQAGVQRLANQHHPIVTGPLQLQTLDGFLALVPEPPLVDVHALAADCVTLLDDFRLPPDKDELARRRAAGLSEAQEANLQRWGYPYVLDDFRFHLTLSRRLTSGENKRVEAMARDHFKPVLGRALVIDSLAIATEPAPDLPLIEHARFPLVENSQRAA
jgi:putative phosphonate metabolism protein